MKLQDLKPYESEYDLDYNDSIICPYCGHKNDITDANYEEDDHEWQCKNCGKEFMYSPNISISWSSEPMEDYFIGKKKNIERHIEFLKEQERDYLKDLKLCYKDILRQLYNRLSRLKKDCDRIFKDDWRE